MARASRAGIILGSSPVSDTEPRQASKLYHAKDYDGMLALLIPLHQKMGDVCHLMLAAVHSTFQLSNATIRERQFVETFGADLKEAYDR